MSGSTRGLGAADLRRFKRYPAYKDSGVEWLGEVPAHWEVERIKWAARMESGHTPDKKIKAYWLGGDIPWVSLADTGQLREVDYIAETAINTTSEGIAHSAARILPSGTVVFSRDATVGLCAITRGRMAVSQHFIGWVCSNRLQPEYLLLVLRSMTQELERLTMGATISTIGMPDVRSLVTPIPPRPEQEGMVGFVRGSCSRIDALVAKKERLIELLEEKRTALITRAVTKGLDPNAPMKDSGVEWLGEIPAHWEVKRLWHLTPADRRIMYGIVLPGPNVDDGIPIVKGGDISPERLRLARLNRTTPEIESGYARSRLRGGDLVYAIRGSIGEVAMIPDELEGANLTQDAARVAYTRATHGPWLLHALKAAAVFAQLEAGALGATIKGVNIRDLKRASIPVPPRGEQDAIAGFLGRETRRMDALVAKVREAINHLEELRTALISAAVTGKIDVRDLA